MQLIELILSWLLYPVGDSSFQLLIDNQSAATVPEQKVAKTGFEHRSQEGTGSRLWFALEPI